MVFSKVPLAVATVLLIALATLTGCFKTERRTTDSETVEGPAETIKGFAYNATENFLIAINLPSYTQFSKNFTKELKQSFTEEDFKNFSDVLKEKHGLYSRNTSKQFVTEVQEKEDGTVTFLIGIEFVKEGQTDTEKVPFQITYGMVEDNPKIISVTLDDTSIAP